MGLVFWAARAAYFCATNTALRRKENEMNMKIKKQIEEILKTNSVDEILKNFPNRLYDLNDRRVLEFSQKDLVRITSLFLHDQNKAVIEANFIYDKENDVAVQGFFMMDAGNIEILNVERAWDVLNGERGLLNSEDIHEDSTLDSQVFLDGDDLETEIMLFCDEDIVLSWFKYKIGPDSGIRMPIAEIPYWISEIGLSCHNLSAEVL